MSTRIDRPSSSIASLSGFTFIEILITLSLLMLIILQNSQAIHAVFIRQQASTLLEQLQNSLTFARSKAIYSNSIVTVCPIEERHCGEEWSSGLLIFIDSNNNQTVDENENPLKVIHFSQTNFSITWTASGRKKILRFSPSGTAREFGRFNFCNKKDRTLAAQTLVVSRMGKTRRYRDRDQDGYVEDRDGRKPDC